jgi:hypothetical protein
MEKGRYLWCIELLVQSGKHCQFRKIAPHGFQFAVLDSCHGEIYLICWGGQLADSLHQSFGSVS